ncbi:unnamed protein product [Oikopleura dioica]|uniref:Aldehyde dehydrogenase domain-containing protein n=1 Tax=Oikopleura dioica TaxID=34765 RepID=E4YCD5_OIKDI|nr:unnamed protein product [Oikopleura dioica]
MEPIVIQNYINGEFYPTEEYIDSVDPATLEIVSKVPRSKAEEVDKAVKSAEAAFESWSILPPSKRAQFIFKIADLIDANLERLALLESRDQGKTVGAARMIDIPRAAENFRFFAKVISNPESERTTLSQNARGTPFTAISSTNRVPVGVAGLISPWNLPLYLLSWKIGPALAFGNTCVCKPSEMTSTTAFELCKLMVEAGLPAGVCNMVFGYGHEAGEALVLHPDVPLISFTGSTAIGARIMEKTAPMVKKVSLELGGKNPAIIFEDADINAAAAGCARSSFTNQGEVCLCTERIYVHESVYDEFMQKFIAEARKFTVGDPRNPATRCGALCGKPHYDKVISYFEYAKEKGFVVYGHGKNNLELPENVAKGLFVHPTICTNVPEDDKMVTEEIFGPVTVVNTFSSEAEAIQKANATKYGLCATVWSQDLSRVQRVPRKIKAATVWVNCWLIRDLHMPFGGMKTSGVGRESAVESMEFFTEQQTICSLFDPRSSS